MVLPEVQREAAAVAIADALKAAYYASFLYDSMIVMSPAADNCI
jgi:hypothetical protein